MKINLINLFYDFWLKELKKNLSLPKHTRALVGKKKKLFSKILAYSSSENFW